MMMMMINARENRLETVERPDTVWPFDSDFNTEYNPYTMMVYDH